MYVYVCLSYTVPHTNWNGCVRALFIRCVWVGGGGRRWEGKGWEGAWEGKGS